MYAQLALTLLIDGALPIPQIRNLLATVCRTHHLQQDSRVLRSCSSIHFNGALPKNVFADKY